jgi:hypothetical protein
MEGNVAVVVAVVQARNNKRIVAVQVIGFNQPKT